MITMKYKMSKGLKIMITVFISVYLGNLVLDVLSDESNINIWIARIIGLFVVLIIYLPLNFLWIKNSKKSE
ncbi:Putative secreted protein (plasmid) [Lactococcus lactis subsp. lactis]|nr:Putative secreted protein [Lactococcus lactis subsp. lactis]